MDLVLLDKLLVINWIGVAVASVAAFVFGFTWYHWKAFGKAWATGLGISKEEADNVEGMGGVFAFSVVGGVVKAIFLALLIEGLGAHGLSNGLVVGLIIGVAFVATSIAYHDGFARRSRTVTWINSLHDIVELGLIGAIYSLF